MRRPGRRQRQPRHGEVVDPRRHRPRPRPRLRRPTWPAPRRRLRQRHGAVARRRHRRPRRPRLRAAPPNSAPAEATEAAPPRKRTTRSKAAAEPSAETSAAPSDGFERGQHGRGHGGNAASPHDASHRSRGRHRRLRLEGGGRDTGRRRPAADRGEDPADARRTVRDARPPGRRRGHPTLDPAAARAARTADLRSGRLRQDDACARSCRRPALPRP